MRAKGRSVCASAGGMGCRRACASTSLEQQLRWAMQGAQLGDCVPRLHASQSSKPPKSAPTPTPRRHPAGLTRHHGPHHRHQQHDHGGVDAVDEADGAVAPKRPVRHVPAAAGDGGQGRWFGGVRCGQPRSVYGITELAPGWAGLTAVGTWAEWPAGAGNERFVLSNQAISGTRRGRTQLHRDTTQRMRAPA